MGDGVGGAGEGSGAQVVFEVASGGEEGIISGGRLGERILLLSGHGVRGGKWWSDALRLVQA